MKLEDENSERDRIKAVISAVGPMPVREIARHCMEAGIWDEDQRENFIVEGAIKRVKMAVRYDTDGSGLAWAAAIGKGKDAILKQRELFEYSDYESVIVEGVSALIADHARLRGYQVECRAKFGEAPAIPSLTD